MMTAKRAIATTRMRATSGRFWLAGLFASTALAFPTTAHSDAFLRDLADQASSFTWYNAAGVSGNGNYVVGTGTDGNGESAFFYDLTTGTMQTIGQYSPGAATNAYDVSNTGVAVGLALDSGLQYEAFRWTAGGGFQLLGSQDGVNTTGRSIAYGVSDDGTRIVGWATGAAQPSQEQAYVWIEGATTGLAANPQMHLLTGFAADARAYAQGISSNGQFAVGFSTPAGGLMSMSHAVRWNLANVTVTGTALAEDLGTLGGDRSTATAVNADGRVVVGWSRIDATIDAHAFRWVEGGTGGIAANPQMQDLGTLGGQHSTASGVSADGNIIVGWSGDTNGNDKAFRWTQATGMISVADWLTQNGVDMGNITLWDATGISNDGSVIVGRMNDPSNPDGDSPYIARVSVPAPAPDPGPNPQPGPNPAPNPPPAPAPQPGIMNVNEYNRTVYDAAYAGWAGGNGFRLALNGAHHRPLMDISTERHGVCGWINGDIARYDNGGAAGAALAEAGLCGDLLDGTVRIGLGGGLMQSSQELVNDGSADIDGQYVLGELNWRPAGGPAIFSVTGLYGGGDADIRRAYTNGAAMAYSDAQTDLETGSLRLRADWRDAFRLGSTSFSPYVSYTWSRTAIDGYTETGGSFPARFDRQVSDSSEVRLGIASASALTSALTLRASLELAHAAGDAPHASGQVLGLHGFAFGSGSYHETWLRAGTDIDVKLSERAGFSLSLHAASQGLDAQVSGAARFHVLF